MRIVKIIIDDPLVFRFYNFKQNRKNMELKEQIFMFKSCVPYCRFQKKLRKIQIKPRLSLYYHYEKFYLISNYKTTFCSVSYLYN